MYTGVQTVLEEMLNKTYQKLEAEEERREKNDREIKALEVRRVWGVKIQDAQKVVDKVIEKMSQLESRVRQPAGKPRGLVSLARSSNANKSTNLDDKRGQDMVMLEDSGALLVYLWCVVTADS
jgi:hypothetical protein